MKSKLIFFSLILSHFCGFSQEIEQKNPILNVRLSFLIFPPTTPLLTFEVKTHGVNLKYFLKEQMNKDFLFLGTAFVQSDYLRKDLKTTILPYVGYGYAHRFGKNKGWIFDSRIGIGPTISADKNIIVPVLKTGIGKII